jgi:hypothetical protein
MGMLEALGWFVVLTRKIPRIVIGFIVGRSGTQTHCILHSLTRTAGYELRDPIQNRGVHILYTRCGNDSFTNGTDY